MEFVIGNNRTVTVYDDTVLIRDKGTRKFISLSLQEFIRVRDYREDISAAVDAIKRNESAVKLRKIVNHIKLTLINFIALRLEIFDEKELLLMAHVFG